MVIIIFIFFFYAVMNEMENEKYAKERIATILEEGCNISVEKNRPKDVPEWFDEKLFVR